jgi:hypothetical protein
LRVDPLATVVAFAFLPMLVTRAHFSLPEAAVLVPHVVILGIAGGLISLKSLVACTRETDSVLDCDHVAHCQQVRFGVARLGWWQVLSERFGFIQEGKKVESEVELELRLELGGSQHVFGSGEHVTETQHQAGGKSLHRLVGVAAAHNGSQQLADLLKLYVIIQLLEVFPLAERAHLGSTGLLKKGLKDVLDEGIRIF